MATDEQLVAKFVAGDEAAFAQLVQRYQRELFSFLQRFINEAALAEDLFQETFIQVYRSAATFDSKRRFRPWLFTIAANKARDYLRANLRRGTQSLDNVAGHDEQQATFMDLMESDTPSAPERLMDMEDAAAVRKIIARMPQMYREVLLLSYYHRFAYKEIAEMLDIPLGTVKSRLHSALAMFGEAWSVWQGEGK
ncbi:MAG: sigma-70 family RNA polymerase sigma factor [Planctomycetia bacterium]|nr:sigma-70 family RNA polymerase sigma factor [Planctomycetia bacterium]